MPTAQRAFAVRAAPGRCAARQRPPAAAPRMAMWLRCPLCVHGGCAVVLYLRAFCRTPVLLSRRSRPQQLHMEGWHRQQRSWPRNQSSQQAWPLSLLHCDACQASWPGRSSCTRSSLPPLSGGPEERMLGELSLSMVSLHECVGCPPGAVIYDDDLS
jgi:hypothetical protein